MSIPKQSLLRWWLFLANSPVQAAVAVAHTATATGYFESDHHGHSASSTSVMDCAMRPTYLPFEEIVAAAQRLATDHHFIGGPA